MKGQKEALVVNQLVKRKALSPEVHHIQAGRLRMKNRKEALAVNQLKEKRRAINQEVPHIQGGRLRMRGLKEVPVANLQAKRKALRQEAHHIQEGQHLMKDLKEAQAVKSQQIRNLTGGHQKAELENAVIARIISHSANLKTHPIINPEQNATLMINHSAAGKSQQRMQG